MEYRTLDLTVSSAEDLKKVTHLSKLRPFAVAWVDAYNRHSTRVDPHGGANPSWNERFSFSLPEYLFQQPGSRLHVEIYSKGSLFGNKFVGAAAIPLSELTQQSNSKELVTYQLRRRSGKVKGAVRLLVQIGEKMAMPGQSTEYPGAAIAYPYDNHKTQQNYYPQPPSGGYGYPPQQLYQPYPPQGYYPQQGYYPPQQYAQPPRRPGMMGGMGGMGTGLLAGALGGLIVGDLIGDAFDNGGGGGGYDGGGYDGGGGGYDGGGGFDGGGFDGGGFDGGF